MISIVMPAHNEQGYLEPAVKAVLAGMRDRDAGFEVVIVENGSVDDTAAEAAVLAQTFPEVRVLRSPAADYGKALKSGFRAATGDIVVNFDVDLVDLGFLDAALGVITSTDAAIVVGSKRSPGAEDQRSIGRRFITAAFAAVLRVVFGLRISDTHGLKAMQRLPLVDLVERCQFGADIFDTELILRAERAGLTVEEVPVVVREQRAPRTSILRRIPGALLGLGRLRLSLLWGR
jgi:glycosyltransferase involved in cell wall biosynthesis